MKFSDWLNKQDITPEDFADTYPEFNEHTVTKYANGQRRPGYETAQRIRNITGGLVGFDDWLKETAA